MVTLGRHSLVAVKSDMVLSTGGWKLFPVNRLIMANVLLVMIIAGATPVAHSSETFRVRPDVRLPGCVWGTTPASHTSDYAPNHLLPRHASTSNHQSSGASTTGDYDLLGYARGAQRISGGNTRRISRHGDDSNIDGLDEDDLPSYYAVCAASLPPKSANNTMIKCHDAHPLVGHSVAWQVLPTDVSYRQGNNSELPSSDAIFSIADTSYGIPASHGASLWITLRTSNTTTAMACVHQDIQCHEHIIVEPNFLCGNRTILHRPLTSPIAISGYVTTNQSIMSRLTSLIPQLCVLDTYYNISDPPINFNACVAPKADQNISEAFLPDIFASPMLHITPFKPNFQAKWEDVTRFGYSGTFAHTKYDHQALTSEALSNPPFPPLFTFPFHTPSSLPPLPPIHANCGGVMSCPVGECLATTAEPMPTRVICPRVHAAIQTSMSLPLLTALLVPITFTIEAVHISLSYKTRPGQSAISIAFIIMYMPQASAATLETDGYTIIDLNTSDEWLNLFTAFCAAKLIFTAMDFLPSTQIKTPELRRIKHLHGNSNLKKALTAVCKAAARMAQLGDNFPVYRESIIATWPGAEKQDCHADLPTQNSYSILVALTRRDFYFQDMKKPITLYPGQALIFLCTKQHYGAGLDADTDLQQGSWAGHVYGGLGVDEEDTQVTYPCGATAPMKSNSDVEIEDDPRDDHGATRATYDTAPASSHHLAAITTPEFLSLPSTVGAPSPSNRGLFLGPNHTLFAGSVYLVHFERVESIPMPTSVDVDGTIKQWEQKLESKLSKWDQEGLYSIQIGRKDIGLDDPVVYQGAFMSEPRVLTGRQLRQYVNLAPMDSTSISYAVMHPDTSMFNLMNDAAYDDACTSSEYESRARSMNHAEFVAGVNHSGVNDNIYVRFYRDAAAGDELFVTYGWSFWAEHRRMFMITSITPSVKLILRQPPLRQAAVSASKISYRERRRIANEEQERYDRGERPNVWNGVKLFLRPHTQLGYEGVSKKCYSMSSRPHVKRQLSRFVSRVRNKEIGHFDSVFQAAEAYARFMRGISGPTVVTASAVISPSSPNIALMKWLLHTLLGSAAALFIVLSMLFIFTSPKRAGPAKSQRAVLMLMLVWLVCPVDATPDTSDLRQSVNSLVNHWGYAAVLSVLTSIAAVTAARSSLSDLTTEDISGSTSIASPSSSDSSEPKWLLDAEQILQDQKTDHKPRHISRISESSPLPPRISADMLEDTTLVSSSMATPGAVHGGAMHQSMSNTSVIPGTTEDQSLLKICSGIVSYSGTSSPGYNDTHTLQTIEYRAATTIARSWSSHAYYHLTSDSAPATHASVGDRIYCANEDNLIPPFRFLVRSTTSANGDLSNDDDTTESQLHPGLMAEPQPARTEAGSMLDKVEIMNDALVVIHSEAQQATANLDDLTSESMAESIMPVDPDLPVLQMIPLASTVIRLSSFVDVSIDMTSVKLAPRQSRRSVCYGLTRAKHMGAGLFLSSVPSRIWIALSVCYRLYRRAKHRLTVLHRCRLLLCPTFKRILLELHEKAQKRRLREESQAQVLILLSSTPKPMCEYDVNVDSETGRFIYRSVRGDISYQHPTATISPAPAYSQDGSIVSPLFPPASSSLVLVPEFSGGWCYYDVDLGLAQWFAPADSTHTCPSPAFELELFEDRPPTLDPKIQFDCLDQTSWLHLPHDQDNSILLYNKLTGSIRNAPWIALRTKYSRIFFANLVTRQTRWFPPHGWMDGWVSHPDADAAGMPIVPFARQSIYARMLMPAKFARMRIEGGSSYLTCCANYGGV